MTDIASSFAYANAQLFNPGFMASMAMKENVLGDCLSGMNEILATPGTEDSPVGTEDSPVSFFQAVDSLNGRFRRAEVPNLFSDAFTSMPNDAEVFRNMKPADVLLAQERLAAAARKHLDPRLHRLAMDINDNRAGIPLGRPSIGRDNSAPLIHAGFLPKVLRTLVDAGAISRPVAAELGAALVWNLGKNVEALEGIEGTAYPDSRIHYFLSPLFFLAGATSLVFNFSTYTVYAGVLGLAAGAFFLFDHPSFKQNRAFNRTLDMPTFPTSTIIRELREEQEILRASYAAALGDYPKFLDAGEGTPQAPEAASRPEGVPALAALEAPGISRRPGGAPSEDGRAGS